MILHEANVELSGPRFPTRGCHRTPFCLPQCEQAAGTDSRITRRKAAAALSEAGVCYGAVTLFAGCSRWTVRRWTVRGIPTGEFRDRARCGRPSIYNEETRLRIVAFYCQTQPLPGCGRWTLRWAAAHLAVHRERLGASPSKSTLHRTLRNNKLRPHLSAYFLHITDPDFFPKAERLFALYAEAPANLYFFDECPGIQILKRLSPDLRTRETSKRLEEFEYIRNGTMDVFAFMHHSDGTVYAECHGDHKTPTFLGVFRRHVARCHPHEQLHYVADNLSSHRSYPFCELVAELSAVPCPPEKELNTQIKRTEWLQSEKKRIVIHFTPFHGSWLNLIEVWFGIMGGKVLTESFDGADALKAAFEAFLEQWNQILAHPLNWNYNGKGLHRKAVQRFTEMLRSSAERFEVRILTNMLKLMTNLLNDYFGKVPETTWHELADAALSERETLVALIAGEDGPRRRKQAEKALATFTVTISERVHGLTAAEKVA